MAHRPFPIGLTLDEALQRGWSHRGRALIATDDGPIREPGPFDDVIDLAYQLQRRRLSDDSARGRILAAMKRGKALARADRKRRRRAKASWSVDDDPLVSAVLRIVAAALAGR
jgi:hypothetical protein